MTFRRKLLVIVGIVLMSGAAWAQGNYLLDYFAGNPGPTPGAPDQLLRIINVGASGSPLSSPADDICINLYVFDYSQEMIACCSCRLSANAMALASVGNQLTSNPITSVVPVSGVIKIVNSIPNPVCNATAVGAVTDGVVAFATRLQSTGGGTYVSETSIASASLSDAELGFLQTECSSPRYLGGSKGTCGCTVGDTGPLAPPPPAADFAISVSPASVSLAEGTTSAPVTVSVIGANGFAAPVSVAISGLPAGASISPISPLNVTAGSSQQFTITAAIGAAIGNSTIMLHATSDSLAHNASFSVDINSLTYAQLDTDKWINVDRAADPSNSEPVCYKPYNTIVSGGELLQVLKYDAGVPCSYAFLDSQAYHCTSGSGTQPCRNNISGSMVMWKTFSYTYGKLEIRAKMAHPVNSWPAFWMMGHNCQGTMPTTADSISPCNWGAVGSEEIDVAEFYDDSVTTARMNFYTTAGGWSYCGPSFTFTDATQNYHVYSLDWTPGNLTFQVDDQTPCTISRADVPSTPEFLMLQTTAHSDYSDAGIFTQHIDYVKVTANGSTAGHSPGDILFFDDFNPLATGNGN